MNTIFLLLAEFGQADVPVETVCSRYLGLDERQAKRQASSASLPFPVYRPGTQKGPWLARITDVAAWLARDAPGSRPPAGEPRRWQRRESRRSGFLNGSIHLGRHGHLFGLVCCSGCAPWP